MMVDSTVLDSNKKQKEERVSRINFRVTREEEELIHAGAAIRGVTMTTYLLQSARKQAEDDLADRKFFSVPRETLDAFHAALDRPVQEKPRLRRLFSEPSILERKIDENEKRSRRSSAFSGRKAKQGS